MSHIPYRFCLNRKSIAVGKGQNHRSTSEWENFVYSGFPVAGVFNLQVVRLAEEVWPFGTNKTPHSIITIRGSDFTTLPIPTHHLSQTEHDSPILLIGMKAVAKLGSGDKTITVGKVGHGIMLMTWVPNPVSDEDAFDAIKASLDSVPPGAKMVLNSAEFYGINPREANLEMLARVFEKYPSYTEKAFLAVKGALSVAGLQPDSSPDNLKRSVDNILAKLRGTKKLDMFQPARVDKKYPIEDTVKVLSGFVAEGKFDYVGLSECKASTVKRANAVHPIAAVEIEVSPWSYDDPVKEIIATCRDLGTVIFAYSPLGRGFLSGKYKSINDLEDGDIRRHTERIQEEYWKHNIAIVEGVQALAAKKSITPAQFCIAWVSALGPHLVPIPGSSKKQRTEENCAAADVELKLDDVKSVEKVLEENPVKGNRFGSGSDEDWHLWG